MIGDLTVRTRWRRGPAAGSDGPFLVSYTEFTPDSLRDLPRIYLAARELCRACGDLDGAVGVSVYWQLHRRRGGSVSCWESEAALRRFVSLPFHLEIMRRYRNRGQLRANSWIADRFALREALATGRRTLEEGKGRH